MTTQVRLRRRLISSISAAAVVAGTALGSLAVAPSASAAPSATAGLYGSADPTYDGVFRQSLALMGLTAVGATPASQAITWLLNEQCANGGFQAYRADLGKACDPADPVSFTGPDTNSTAVAVMALMSLLSMDTPSALPTAQRGRVVKAAVHAVTWLGDQQNPDGGWGFTSHGASDANSTGLSLAALLTQAPNDTFPAFVKGSRFLGRQSFPCSAGGGLAYQPGGPVNASATAQGLTGLAGPMPVDGPRRLSAGAPCANTAKAKSASFLAATLARTGTLPSPLGTDPDYSNTAAAVLGLVGAGQGRAAVAKATAALKAAAPAYSTHSGGPDAGALGLLLMVAEATGSSPTSFGGVNLVSSLAGSIRK